MDSPLARMIMLVLGGYLFILLSLAIYDWIREEFPSPPANPPVVERVRHPRYHEQAVVALQRLSRLPESEKDAIKENLESSLISMEQWMTHLGQSNYQVMCLGELHEDSTRNFLAEEFFAKFSFDVLLLEATPAELKRSNKKMNAGRTYFPLLGADIIDILRAVRDKNPHIRIFGIEESAQQEKEQQGIAGARDRSIARNFWNGFQPGMRHIILFGALHCTNDPKWLFQNLRGQAPLSVKNRMLNAWVLGEHQNGPLEAFVFFLDQIGIEKKNFVIPDTSGLHPRIYELFQSLNRQILEKFNTLIVFRK